MFTGLVQDVGKVAHVDALPGGMRLHIETRLAPKIDPGDSIAVDGVCLTATRANAAHFECEAMYQTLGLAVLPPSGPVNLELAMLASDRLGGHIVQGHIDGSGEVVAVEEDGIARRLRVGLAPELLRYVVAQGSIALGGVSLTVADLGDAWVVVSLIPETLERTNLGEAKPGDRLNVECDLVAKYVERLAAPFAGKEQP